MSESPLSCANSPPPRQRLEADLEGEVGRTLEDRAIAGWRDALRSHGRSDGLLVRTGFTRAGGYQAAQRVLAGSGRPIAMFVSSDLQAFGVLRAIREQGLDVPGDLALVTFDGIEESAFSWPPLTLTQQPLQAMAEAAISALLGANDAAHDLFPMELIIRQSCGCGRNGGHSA